MTKVYLCDLKNIGFDEKTLFLNIPSCFHIKIKKYKKHPNRLGSLLGYYLLTKYLFYDFKIDLNKEKVLFNEFGKPYIQKDIYFSIAHSKDIVSIIISNNNCGIDVEMFDKSKDYSLLSSKLFNDKLVSAEEVIKKWVQLEAYYKYKGTGIVYSALNILLEDKNIILKDFESKNGDKYYYAFILEETSFDVKLIEEI